MRCHTAVALLAAALLSLQPVGVLAQQSLTRGRVEQDVRFFVRTLEETHPDPYTAFGGKLEFKRRVGTLLAQIPADGLDAAGVYELLMAFIADLGDAHTRLLPAPPLDPDVTPRLLPLRFAVATDAVFVSEGAQGFEELMGHRLLAVEGIPINRLTATAGKIFPAENAYGRARALTQTLPSARYGARLLGHRLDTLRLRLERPGGGETTWRVPYLDQSALAEADWSRGSRSGPEAGERPIWWRYLEPEGAGYLRLESIEGAEAFREARSRQDLPGYVSRYYRRYFDREAPADLDRALAGIPCFTEIVRELLGVMRAEGGEYLIIDLRDNDGGWSALMYPLYLFAFGAEYLDYPFPDLWVDVASPQLMELNGWTEEDFASEWGLEYALGDYRFEVAGRPRGDRSLVEYAAELGAYGCGLADAFQGLAGEPLYRPTVIVLLNPGTFSAAYQLAYKLWRLGAVLVGVPSAQAGNAYTNVVQVELPNSGLTGSVSRSAQIYFPDDEALGRVLEPEFPMAWSDYARHDFDRDSELIYALDLITRGRITRRRATSGSREKP